MVNLDILYIICTLCSYQAWAGRHCHVSFLEPRRWRHVSFICFCTAEPFWCETLLSAPIFRTVEALRWSSHSTPWAERQDHPGILPNVTALALLGRSLKIELSRSPIRRVVCSLHLICGWILTYIPLALLIRPVDSTQALKFLLTSQPSIPFSNSTLQRRATPRSCLQKTEV